MAEKKKPTDAEMAEAIFGGVDDDGFATVQDQLDYMEADDIEEEMKVILGRTANKH